MDTNTAPTVATPLVTHARTETAGLAEKIVLRRQETNITVSIGVSTFPKDAQMKEELIYKADHALYRAKEEGRNRVCIA